jgi:hypothetical protein
MKTTTKEIRKGVCKRANSGRKDGRKVSGKERKKLGDQLRRKETKEEWKEKK